MGLVDKLKEGFDAGVKRANPDADPAAVQAVKDELERKIREESPPSIAVVGEAGVGKSSTLNALFNAGLEISHTRACTRSDIELTIDLTEPADAFPRQLVVYDMPGLGESIQADKHNIEFYRRVLPKVDVVLWVLDAQNRAIRSVQERLLEDIAPIDGSLSKLVLALNKVDLVDPGATGWNDQFNVPGREQTPNIAGREQDVAEKIREVIPTWTGETVAYSAIRRYRLSTLFRAMIEGVAEHRQWLLGDRMALASYEERVEEGILRAVQERYR